MKFPSLLLLLTLSIAGAVDWTLPAANQGAWVPGTNIGVPGGIDQYLAGGVNDRATTGTVINAVSAHSADNTGATDCQAAIVAALAAASGPTVVYFPAGTYLLDSGYIYSLYKDNITIRGAGVGVTTFHVSTTNPIFLFSAPGTMDQNPRTITGTKTKGTATLTIGSVSGYTVGKRVMISYENETDSARIQAGASLTWTSAGFPKRRAVLADITAVGADSITIDPPLPADATYLALTCGTNASDSRTEGWGFEDFSVTFDTAQHTTQFVDMDSVGRSWFHNLDFEDWSKKTDSGSCIKMTKAYQCEVRKCRGNAVIDTGVGSDGFVETVNTTSCLMIDNIIIGQWGSGFYDSGNAVNNAWSYNYRDFPASSLSQRLISFHDAHPSLNILEGNVGPFIQADGYHGSASQQTFYRNYVYGPTVALGRMNRNNVIAGNVIGEDGTTDGGLSLGNPNNGNGAADGFAGPTGLSDQEGELDYTQPGYGVGGGSINTYVIQAGDISAGDFWQDWEITATLTTRTSDLVGVFTVAGGDWFTGSSLTGGNVLRPTVWWDSKASSMLQGYVTAVSGNQVTCTWTSGVLPSVSTAVLMYPGAAGWQERDLDVGATLTKVENYYALASGTGSLQNGTTDTLPDSMMYASKPAFFGSLTWPPVNPNSPTFSAEIIPAGYRAINEAEPPSGGPTITTGTLSIGGALTIGN